jgi:predicted enzyme related to lactoylglutathione lyase
MAEMLVNVDVPDLERAIAFYTQAFELRLGRRLGGDFAELLGAPAPIYLLHAAPGTPAVPGAALERDYGRHWTPVHLDFVVPALDSALECALAAGATLERAPTEHAYGRLALLSDPFGHGICLLQFNERGYDAIVSG